MDTIEQLQSRVRQLQRLAYLDSLTQLPNRLFFGEALKREWSRATRNGTPIALLFLDLNGLKKLNDGQGHEAGDNLLRGFAAVLKKIKLRGYDFPARLGGDEFAVLLPDSSKYGADRVAESILKVSKAVGISVAIGSASMVPSPENRLEELIFAADKAMYADKRARSAQVKQ